MAEMRHRDCAQFLHANSFTSDTSQDTRRDSMPTLASGSSTEISFDTPISSQSTTPHHVDNYNIDYVDYSKDLSPFAGPLNSFDDIDGVGTWADFQPLADEYEATISQGFEGFGWNYEDFQLYPRENALDGQVGPGAFASELPEPPIFESDQVLPASEAARVAVTQLLPEMGGPSDHMLSGRPREADAESSPKSAFQQLPSKQPLPVTPNKVTKRHFCKKPGCSKSFTRPSDLARHEKDVHKLSTSSFECLDVLCSHQTRRKDKMREHCRTVHKHVERRERFRVVFREPALTGVLTK